MTTGPVHNQPEPYTSPPVTIIVTIILLILFFVGFFSIYFCRCLMDNIFCRWYLRQSPAGTPVGPTCQNDNPGLDPSIIKTFPNFIYSSVKDLRKDKYGLECAICLAEFVDNDMLRLLTTCCHVFHEECIDLWLESHKTCPVCRRSLDEPEKSPEKSPAPTNYSAMHEINENELMEDAVSISIKDDNDEEEEEERKGYGGREVAQPSTTALTVQQSGGENKMERFSRSHSTGHSIVRSNRSEEDRFTLRLPEHLHLKLLRGHNWTGSCTTFGEFKSKTTTGNGGFGEVSDFSGGDVNRV